jgi:hypothetical protein
VLDYKGRSFEVRADQFVVAAGAIESSRLLLASAHVPNEYDQLGRFFHDHLSLHAAVLPRAARGRIFDRLGPFFVNGVLHTCRMEATSELQREQGLLAVMPNTQRPGDLLESSNRSWKPRALQRSTGRRVSSKGCGWLWSIRTTPWADFVWV